MENKKIDFIVHESAMSRLERTNKRLTWITVLVLILFTGLLGYTIWLLNDISVEETNTQEVYDIDTVDGNIINGDNYGSDKTN